MAINLDNYINQPTSKINLDKYLNTDQQAAYQKALNTPPAPPTPQAPAQPKNIFQKTGDVVKDFGVGLAKPFVKSYELLTQGAKAYGAVAKGGVQLLKGDKAGAKETLNTEAKRLQEERAKPIEFGGQQINRITNMKEAAGTALEVASFAVGGSEALAAKNIIKQTLAEGLKVGAKQVAKRMAVGATGMALYGAGEAMQENKGAKEIAINAVKNAGIGALFEVGMLGLGAGGALAARKFENVLKGLKPRTADEIAAAVRGEEYLPSKIKVGEVVSNKADNKVSYQKELSLGKDANGQPILSRTEINPKTGEAKIFLDKSLDKTPGRKALIIENAHDDIVRLKTNPAPQVSKTVAQKSVEDFEARIGKTKEEIAAAIKKEATKPVGQRPITEALLNHQTNVDVNILTTTLKDLEEKHIKSLEEKLTQKSEAYKAEQAAVKPSEETYTPKAAQRLEQEAIAKKIIQDPVGIPQVEKVHIVDQIALHSEIESDRNLIDRILLGEVEAPGKLKSASVWRIESEKAAKNGDVGMIQKLAKSPLARQFSEEGANIAMLRGMERDNPVNVIKRLSDLRSAAKGGKVKENAVAKEIKDAIKKVSPSKQSWADFIEEIKCR
jgi:hypothetical protein